MSSHSKRINGINSIQEASVSEELQCSFINRVFGWMTLGLVLTAVTMMYLNTKAFFGVDEYGSRQLGPLWWLAFIAEIVIVMLLSSGAKKLNAFFAGLLFFVYSVLTGITIAPMIALFTEQSIAAAFFATSGMFGIMGIIGWTTKKDLSGWGGILTMALIGLIIASVVSMFVPGMSFAINVIGVIIFVGLTAYDVQNVKKLAKSMGGLNDRELLNKVAVIGALTLYLDFINIFLHILAAFGDRKK